MRPDLDAIRAHYEEFWTIDDEELIAAARSDVPVLLDYIRELEDVNTELVDGIRAVGLSGSQSDVRALFCAVQRATGVGASALGGDNSRQARNTNLASAPALVSRGGPRVKIIVEHEPIPTGYVEHNGARYATFRGDRVRFRLYVGPIRIPVTRRAARWLSAGRAAKR